MHLISECCWKGFAKAEKQLTQVRCPTLRERSQWYVPEGFVHRPVPTNKGAGGEEENPEYGKAETNSTIGIRTEHSQTGDEIKEQSACCD